MRGTISQFGRTILAILVILGVFSIFALQTDDAGRKGWMQVLSGMQAKISEEKDMNVAVVGDYFQRQEPVLRYKGLMENGKVHTLPKGKRIDLERYFQVTDADGRPGRLKILKIEKEKELTSILEDQHYVCFPESGIYYITVLGEDEWKKQKIICFSIPVEEK